MYLKKPTFVVTLFFMSDIYTLHLG